MHFKLILIALGVVCTRYCNGDEAQDVGTIVKTPPETESPEATVEASATDGKKQSVTENSDGISKQSVTENSDEISTTGAVETAGGSEVKVENEKVVTDRPSEMKEGDAPNVELKSLNESDLEKKCVISNATHWSWLVKIVDKTTQKHVCTGTLITDEDILVPASCFLDNTSVIPDSFYQRGQKLIAIAGGTTNTTGMCKQTRNVSVIYPHKGYFEDTEEHDYAFVKVSPEFDVDDEDIPDLRYHLNVINSEGGLVNIHNNGPFCESPFFVDDGTDVLVAEERHLLGMRIEDCMMKWGCPADFEGCLGYLHPASYACLKPLAPRKCTSRDRGAPLVCNDVFLGYLHLCDGEKPMIFRGLNKAIKFLELEEDHVQQPGYLGHTY